MKPNDFDKIAFIYDELAKMIFGKCITKSQNHFLNKIPDKANVLILGGGTGSILEELPLLKPGIKICYIDASIKMIEQAKEKSKNDNRVQFIHGTENDIPNEGFEVVITNFYLDLFPPEPLKNVVLRIKESLKRNAIWIATDFNEKTWWNKALLKLMYTFFRITANIEANKLPDWNGSLTSSGGRKTESKFFYRNFIEATVFQF